MSRKMSGSCSGIKLSYRREVSPFFLTVTEKTKDDKHLEILDEKLHQKKTRNQPKNDDTQFRFLIASSVSVILHAHCRVKIVISSDQWLTSLDLYWHTAKKKHTHKTNVLTNGWPKVVRSSFRLQLRVILQTHRRVRIVVSSDWKQASRDSWREIAPKALNNGNTVDPKSCVPYFVFN